MRSLYWLLTHELLLGFGLSGSALRHGMEQEAQELRHHRDTIALTLSTTLRTHTVRVSELEAALAQQEHAGHELEDKLAALCDDMCTTMTWLNSTVHVLARDREAAVQLAQAQHARSKVEDTLDKLIRKNSELKKVVATSSVTLAALQQQLVASQQESERLEQARVDGESRSDTLQRQLVALQASHARLLLKVPTKYAL
jgi:chromosome segregation ATPase